jgi:hypothetical protein
MKRYCSHIEGLAISSFEMKRHINSVIIRIQSNIAQKITLKNIPKFRYKMVGFEGSI